MKMPLSVLKTTEDKEQEDKKLPELSEGQTFDGVQTKISEHYTTPPKRFTEDSLLSAMERAGNEDMSDDVERKGLGTLLFSTLIYAPLFTLSYGSKV